MASLDAFRELLTESAIKDFSNDVFGATRLCVVDDGACLTGTGMLERVRSAAEGWVQSINGRLLPDARILGRVYLMSELMEDGERNEGHQ